MKLGEYLERDWEANSGNRKGQLVVYLFRWAWWFRSQRGVMRCIGIPYLVIYRVLVEWILGIEIPPLTAVGAGLQVHHGQGLVVNNLTVIGEDCVLRHGVTLGNKGSGDADGCPVLGDRVELGAGAVVIGRVKIGDDAVIGANTVVVSDVGAGHVVVGNPARVLRRTRSEDQKTQVRSGE